MSVWFYYYKWWLLLGAVVLCILVSILWNALEIGQVKPDYYVAYVGSKPLPDQCVEALEKNLADLGTDLNGDDRVAVELRQYLIGAEGSGSEDVMYGYAAQITLLADITDGESYIFLVEDPLQFQLDFQILAEMDGSAPEDDDFLAADKVFRWSDCPVLSGLELGSYEEHYLDQTAQGACQELLSGLYIGRRYFYDESAVKDLAEKADFWHILTEGAHHEEN